MLQGLCDGVPQRACAARVTVVVLCVCVCPGYSSATDATKRPFFCMHRELWSCGREQKRLNGRKAFRRKRGNGAKVNVGTVNHLGNVF